MNRLLLAIMLTAAATIAGGPANAEMPVFTAQCPDNHTVETNRNGKVHIDGKKANVTKFNENAYEARDHGVKIDFGTDPGGGNLVVTYTGKNGANGICQVTSQGGGQQGSSGAAEPVKVSDLKGMDSIKAFDAMTSRGFNGVDTITSGNTIYGIYYNSSTKQCIQLTNSDNKVVSADDIQTHPKCR